MQNLYTENYKTLLSKIKEDLNQWGAGLYSQIRRVIIVKMSSQIGLQSHDIPNLYKFIWKKPRTAKLDLGKKEQDFKIYYEVTLMQPK